jgi:hypothetical protein
MHASTRSGSRSVILLVAACGLVLAGLIVPASAQTAPPPTLAIDTFRTLRPAGCANPGDNFDLVIGGTTNQTASVSVLMISPTGQTLTKGSAVPSSGRWQTSLTFSYSFTGTYELRASVAGLTASAYLEVPCQAPTLEYSPTCFAPGVQTRLRMTGRHFAPYGTGYMYYDINGSEAQTRIRIPNDAHGVFFADFLVTPSDRDHPGEGRDANRAVFAVATWSKCPPGTTTTSTSTTTSSTTTPDDTVPDETTTSTTRPDLPGPTVTVPPTIDLPPPTPGARLTVAPAVGPAGFVASATGAGFPPGAVELSWSPGIGRTTAIVGPDGTFRASMLVFPNDRLGPRALIAVAGPTTAFAAFLVVQSSVQPSGQDVQQINRIRRFNSR